MSNVITMNCKFFDFLAFQYAASELGLEMRQQHTYKRWSQNEPINGIEIPAGMTAQDLYSCDVAFGLPNNPHAYEIGIKQLPDGSFLPLFDDYDPQLNRVIGKNGINLVTGYEKWAYKNLHPTAQFGETEDSDFIYVTAQYQ